jgi:hypothetical protein
MIDPNYDLVWEATAHADEALEFLKEGYDPEFVAQRARIALFELEGILRDWEPTFAADGLRGVQVRNRVMSARADLLKLPVLADELIKRQEAAKDRGEGVTYGEFGARTAASAVKTLASGAAKGIEKAGAWGPVILGVVVVAIAFIYKPK